MPSSCVDGHGEDEVISELVPTRRLRRRGAKKGETMSYKAMRFTHIAVPSLSILLGACSFTQAPDEESGGTVPADQTINQQLAAGPVWGNQTFNDECVSKTIGPIIP